MDDNKLEGGVTEGVGKLKDAAGGLTGDAGLQAEGKFDQVGGMAQREFGDTLDDAQDQLEGLVSTIRDYPLVAVGAASAVGFLLGALLIPNRRR